MYNKLKELSIQQQGSDYTTVYRGQIMKRSEVDNLKANEGCLISINTFMSTTRDETVAHTFILGADIGILFEIDISDANGETLHPFADISRFGLPDEKEILFSPGTIFRVDSVQELNINDSSLWIIKLTLKKETVEHAERVINCLKKQAICAIELNNFPTQIDDINLFTKYYEILTGIPLTWKDVMTNNIDLTLYLNDIANVFLGNYEKIIEFYQKLLLDENFMDPPKFIILNMLIEFNYYNLFEYDNALFYYATVFSLLNDRNELMSEVYHHIGDVWASMNNFESALSCYQKAVEILNNHHGQSLDFARIWRKIAHLYRQHNNYKVANSYEEQANEIDDNYRKSTDSDPEKSLTRFQNRLDTELDLSPLHRADILHAMGTCLCVKRDYSQALKTFLQEKQLLENHVPPYESLLRKLARLFDNMAGIYFLLNDNLNALIMWKRAIDIRANCA